MSCRRATDNIGDSTFTESEEDTREDERKKREKPRKEKQTCQGRKGLIEGSGQRQGVNRRFKARTGSNYAVMKRHRCREK